MNDQRDRGLECVDPDIGNRILNLAQPTIDADERGLLEAHADVCAFCRLTLDLHHRLGEGIRDGTLANDNSGVPAPGRRRGWTGWTAIAAMAASLVCLIILPPRPVGPGIAGRGPNETRFLRPVEGEVVGGGDLTIAWTQVPDADTYRIRVTNVRNGTTWTESTKESRLVIPADTDLIQGETFRVLLSTVPADLLPPGGASVTFRTGGHLAVVSHRARRAQPVTYVLALAGLALATLFVTGRWSWSRPGVSR